MSFGGHLANGGLVEHGVYAAVGALIGGFIAKLIGWGALEQRIQHLEDRQRETNQKLDRLLNRFVERGFNPPV